MIRVEDAERTRRALAFCASQGKDDCVGCPLSRDPAACARLIRDAAELVEAQREQIIACRQQIDELRSEKRRRGAYMRKKINGLDWKIEVRPATDAAFIIDGALVRGMTQCGKQLILLSGDLDAFTAGRVVMHELTHAFLWSTQAGMPEKYGEEELCDFMACWGAQIIEASQQVTNELFVMGTDNEQAEAALGKEERTCQFEKLT